MQFGLSETSALAPFVRAFSADKLGDASPALKLSEVERGVFHVEISYELPREVRQDDCAARLELGFAADFFWTPHLTPTAANIAAQHIFRTPALIARGAGRTLILIPDVEARHAEPLYLDLDAEGGVMTLGMSRSRVTGHVLYERAAGGRYPAGTAKLSFYLMAADEELENPFRPVLAWFWKRLGHRDMELLPREEQLESYCRRTYEWAFDRWKDVVWQEFEVGGRAVGAPCFIVTVHQRPDNARPCSERETRSIWNQAWFCSLRSASGLYRYARRHGDDRLMEYARKTRELALSFPQQDGLFDSVVATHMTGDRADGSRPWVSAGWDSRYWGNSDRNPFERDIERAPRHILDMSFTAYYMLIWYEELERDERLLAYAGRYAERLVALQLESGYYPAWLSADGAPMHVLDDSPESMMSAAFLFRLYRLTGREACLRSAQRALERVWEDVVPGGRWEDFETYWSCSSFRSDHVGERIARNRMYKQCNFSMYFTALAFMEGYLAEGRRDYLDRGRRVLDEMLMTQSSYQPAAVPIPVCGGFGVMNADGELNDARQSLFSELIMQYGEALGEEEYRERGLAAMRVSFSMMYCPENPEAKAQWEAAWPFLTERDYGFNMENYGHGGEVDAHGMGIGEFTIYDWGNGAAAESCQRLMDHGRIHAT
ncbi:MAG: hypothetical protein ACI4L8_04590 [Candidatus Fimadaptatus sp.]